MPWNIDHAVPVRLRDGELMSLDEAWLAVERGRVWVTLASDPVDHFLDSGHAIRLPRGGRALVSGEGMAELVLLPPPTLLAGLLRRAAQWARLLFVRRRATRRGALPWDTPPATSG